MKQLLLALLTLPMAVLPTLAADTAAPKAPAPPARSKVDPAIEAEHTKEDIKRHRQMAAAHEAAAQCQESGKDEEICNAALAKACQGIAYGKFCGMKHPD
jgi:hypothetical protein